MKEISLSRGFVALVDDDDFEWLSQFKWNADQHGYATRSVYLGGRRNTTRKMHRDICGLSKDDRRQVDHINGKPWDNRRENLRICNNAENNRNRWLQKNNTSGHKGVRWNESNKKWRVMIHVFKKGIHLGYFTDKEQACQAYAEAARKIHQDFVNLGDRT